MKASCLCSAASKVTLQSYIYSGKSGSSLSEMTVHAQVAPAWQRSGLGRALMERLIARLVCDDIASIALFAEPNVVGLYEKLGFIKDPQGVKGLAFQGKLPSIDPIMLL